MAKYNQKTTDKILKLVRTDTYTIAEICRQTGISLATYHRWKQEHPDFARALEEASEERMQYFVQEAKKSLLKKIQGYEITETKVVTIPTKGDSSRPMIKEQTSQKKYIAPDTAAIIFTLTNGDPTKWRNRQTTEIKMNPFQELMESLPDDVEG